MKSPLAILARHARGLGERHHSPKEVRSQFVTPQINGFPEWVPPLRVPQQRWHGLRPHLTKGLANARLPHPRVGHGLKPIAQRLAVVRRLREIRFLLEPPPARHKNKHQSQKRQPQIVLQWRLRRAGFCPPVHIRFIKRCHAKTKPHVSLFSFRKCLDFARDSSSGKRTSP
jgi:hypothetical protein